MKNGFLGLVAEGDVLEGDIAVDGRQDDGAVGLAVLFVLAHDLGGAIETGERLGELGADGDELNDRRDHEGEKHGVFDVAADVEAMGGDFLGAEVHDEGADDSEDHGGGEGHRATAR